MTGYNKPGIILLCQNKEIQYVQKMDSSHSETWY